MRNRRISWSSVLLNFLVALLIGCLSGPAFGVTPLAVAGAIFGAGVAMSAFDVMPRYGLLMAVQRETWVSDLAENIYPDNSFIMQSRDDSPFMGASAVNLPQAGAKPATAVNRTTLPATASKRTDTVKTYPLDEITTDPVVLGASEEVQLSYDKRQSLLMDHVDTITTTASSIIAYRWAATTAGNILRTTGDLRAAYGAGQTGNRRMARYKDFTNAARVMDKQSVPRPGRVALVDADTYNDLLNIPELVTAMALQAGVITNGAIARLAGFDIFMRSEVLSYTNAATPVVKDYDAAAAATDNLGILFWHPAFVRRALGSATNGGIQIFTNEQDPLYYGDVFSALVRVGATHRYTNQRGIIALVEAAS
jgi:hypothetical protein